MPELKVEIGIQSNDGECTQATIAELEVKVKDEKGEVFSSSIFLNCLCF